MFFVRTFELPYDVVHRLEKAQSSPIMGLIGLFGGEWQMWPLSRSC